MVALIIALSIVFGIPVLAGTIWFWFMLYVIVFTPVEESPESALLEDGVYK